MRDGQQAFFEAIGKLAAIDQALRSTIVDQAGEWKRTYVRLRKELQMQLHALSALDRNWPTELADRREPFREAFGELRGLAAAHDSLWPVVMIDRDDPAYQQSAAGVRAAIARVVDTARKAGRPEP